MPLMLVYRLWLKGDLFWTPSSMEPMVLLSLKAREKAAIFFFFFVLNRLLLLCWPSCPQPLLLGPPLFLMTSVGTRIEAGLLPCGRASQVPLWNTLGRGFLVTGSILCVVVQHGPETRASSFTPTPSPQARSGAWPHNSNGTLIPTLDYRIHLSGPWKLSGLLICLFLVLRPNANIALALN